MAYGWLLEPMQGSIDGCFADGLTLLSLDPVLGLEDGRGDNNRDTHVLLIQCYNGHDGNKLLSIKCHDNCFEYINQIKS